MKLQFGFDLGGTKTELAVLNAEGEFLFRQRIATPRESYSLILQSMAELLTTACTQFGVDTPRCVGVGMPGCLDTQTGLVRGSNTLVLNQQPFQKDLMHALGCEVRLQNDANCLALSEAIDGAASDANVVFAAILGTGCGGGIVVNRRLLNGRHSLSGEWGHNPLPWPDTGELQSPACWCGQTGCLETWLSGSGFAKDHTRHTGLSLAAKDIVQAMRDGDAQASASVQRYVHRLGRALAQIINLLDPDCIVLGGGMSNVPEIYTLTCEVMANYSFSIRATTPLRQAKHGDSSGVRGAAWLSE